MGRPIISVANNALNAIHIQGSTIDSTFHPPRMRKGQKEDDVYNFKPLDSEALKGLQLKLKTGESPVLFVDEISNISTLKLALLDARLQQATGVDQPFGSLATFLVGDFRQNGPVAGTILTKAVVSTIVHGEKRRVQSQRLQKQKLHSSEAQRQSQAPQPDTENHRRGEHGTEKKPPKGTEENRYTQGLAFQRAAELITTARWKNLTLQMRNEDPEHQQLLDKYERGESISINDLKAYGQLRPCNFEDAEAGWHSAPVIVTTNREVHSLTLPMSKRFASVEGQIVYQWETGRASKWMGKPPGFLVCNCIDNDGCFWETFVRKAPVYITDNMNKELGLVNGTKAYFHSTTPTNPVQQQEIEDKSSIATVGEVVTLDSPPHSINIEFDSPYDKLTQKRKYAQWLARYDNVTLVPGSVVIPIRQERNKRNAWRRTVVSGSGHLYRPCKVHIKAHFL
jgi:hypothetical protein